MLFHSFLLLSFKAMKQFLTLFGVFSRDESILHLLSFWVVSDDHCRPLERI